MKRKYIYLVCCLAVVLLGTIGCKKFLSLDPSSDLSGNNFWRSKNDVEAFTNGMYQLTRLSVTRKDLTVRPAESDAEFAYFLFTGDLRGAPVVLNESRRSYVNKLSNNNINALFQIGVVEGGIDWYELWNMKRLINWDEFYRVIASANIAYKEIDRVPGLTDAERKSYKAEAVFLRNFCYFFLVRQYGDVPYYLEAYDTEPKARVNMVEVLKNCVADLDPVHADLPWTYSNPVYVAVRAMRGSSIALLMHLNMWLAAFDRDNAQQYYQNVQRYGQELEANPGTYELLPLERTGEIFKGRSKEGLFEIPQNKNYNESFGWGTFYDHTKSPIGDTYPYIAYTKEFMETIYPPTVADARKDFWYDPTTIYLQNDEFFIKKFLVSIQDNSPDKNVFDASQTVFRYSDALLLYAEALANMGNDTEAKRVLNMVRNRARATPITSSGKELKDDIYYERCRELMGEGHWWFDLVRTGRILDNEFGYTASGSQFLAGCWTWPISNDVRQNNPYITPNLYWEN